MATNKVRTVLVIEEEVREALRVESSMSGREMSEIVNDLLRETLAETLELLRKRRAQYGTGTSPSTKKKAKKDPASTQDS